MSKNNRLLLFLSCGLAPIWLSSANNIEDNLRALNADLVKMEQLTVASTIEDAPPMEDIPEAPPLEGAPAPAETSKHIASSTVGSKPKGPFAKPSAPLTKAQAELPGKTKPSFSQGSTVGQAKAQTLEERVAEYMKTRRGFIEGDSEDSEDIDEDWDEK